MKNQPLPMGFIIKSEQHSYRIEKVLGQGSFGITYLATTRVMAQASISGALGSLKQEREVEVSVCIKEFFMRDVNFRSNDRSFVEGSNSKICRDYRARFRKEAENISHMNHPNIVKVSEVFDANNTTYYVMEYLDGSSLDEYIMQKGGVNEDEALTIIRSIAEGLQYMHGQRILHLDLKPKNVMRNSKGEIKLIDFGLSKQFDENGEPESSTSIGHGTRGYAPIEQANYQPGKGFPATLDIYALGATLYKLFTAETPPIANDVLENGLPLRPFKVSDEAWKLVEWAMQPRKKDRLQNVKEFIREVDKCLSRPLQAGDEKPLYMFSAEGGGVSIIIRYKGTNYDYSLYYRGKAYYFLCYGEENYRLEKKETGLSLEDFIQRRKGEKEEVLFAMMTYHETRNSYLKALRLTKEKEFIYNRMLCESHLMMFGLPVPDFEEDAAYKLIYSDGSCVAECGAGICEIMCADEETVVSKTKNECIVQTFEITGQEPEYLVRGFDRIYRILHVGKQGMLLLDSFPFHIKAYLWKGERVRDYITLASKGATMPFKKTETIEDDITEISLEVCGEQFPLHVQSLFGYFPDRLEMTIDCSAIVRREILIILRDVNARKEKEINFKDLVFDKEEEEEEFFQDEESLREELINGWAVVWTQESWKLKNVIRNYIDQMKELTSSYISLRQVNINMFYRGEPPTSPFPSVSIDEGQKLIGRIQSLTSIPFRLPNPYELIQAGLSGLAYDEDEGRIYEVDGHNVIERNCNVSNLPIYLACDKDISFRERLLEIGDEFGLWHFGFCRVKVGDKWGMVNKRMEFVIPLDSKNLSDAGRTRELDDDYGTYFMGASRWDAICGYDETWEIIHGNRMKFHSSFMRKSPEDT